MINFGTMQLIAVPERMADGSLVATPTPVKLAVLQDVTLDLSVELKKLHGSGMYPVAVAQGKGDIAIKAKTANVSGKVLGSMFLGQTPAAGIKDAVLDFAAKVPAGSTYTITVAPPGSGTFVADLGVFDADTGAQLTRVASGAAAGQYSVSAAGVYTFASADANKAVSLSYEYSATSTSAQVFNLSQRQMGYTPSFAVIGRTQYDGKVLTAKFYRGVCSKFSMPFKPDDFTENELEIACFANAAGNVGWLCLQGE